MLRFRHRAARLATASAGAALGYVLALLGAWVILPAPVIVEYPLPYAPRPGYYVMRPGVYHHGRYDTAYRVNADGLRGPEIGPKRGPRVIALGESSTIGLESSDAETWPAHLARLWTIEVINAGIGGTSSAEHAAMLPWLLTFQPDVILYYAGRNDVAITPAHYYPGPRAWPRGLAHFLRHWALARLVDVERWTGVEIARANHWRPATRAHLERMRATGAPLVVIEQQVRGDDPRLVHRLAAYRTLAREVFGTVVVMPQLPAEAFADEVHLTRAGNAALAERIAQAVRRPR